MFDVSLFLKYILPVATRARKKSCKYFDVVKQNRGKNNPLAIRTQTHLEQKRVFTSGATNFMSNHQSLQVTSVNNAKDRFRKRDDIRHFSPTMQLFLFRRVRNVPKINC